MIDATATLVFDESGAISAVRHEWTFDEAYSAWALQGNDTNGNGVVDAPELQAVADDNLAGLADYEFYTYAVEGETHLKFTKLGGATLTNDNGRLTLRFAVAPEPVYRAGENLRIAINDPDYYVAILFEGPNPLVLENAPSNCSATFEAPKDLDPALADRLNSLGPDVTSLPPDLAQALKWVQGAILVRCGGSAPATTPVPVASETAQAAPFGGPPAEPGFAMPRTGLFGWIATQQRDFYVALTNALGRLRSDNNAFWILGSLSFLYGILHAAGPGHGKVVISSYMLANEIQARRGIVLSFVSAMVQAVVAVLLVLIAAAVLNMTSVAMSAAVNWIGIASYAIVALLGAWLVVRKFIGHGHSVRAHPPSYAVTELAPGDNPHEDHPPRNHRHENHSDHDHAPHFVLPTQSGSRWIDGVVVAVVVGLRPCSGALIVMVFALSQGLIAAGIASVFLMALGTAIAVAALAVTAVSAKGLARRLIGEHSGAASLVWWVELAGALLVLAFGLVLLTASV